MKRVSKDFIMKEVKAELGYEEISWSSYKELHPELEGWKWRDDGTTLSSSTDHIRSAAATAMLQLIFFKYITITKM